MTNLEHRALLGDRQAQEECAKKGVMLTCPLCKGKAEEGKQVDVDEYYWWPTICCGNCNLHIVGSELFGEVTEEMRLKWNTRPAPPVGRCRDCAHWYKGHCVSPGLCAAEETDAEFYCQNFEPKEGEKVSSIVFNEDCIEGMARYPDKYFDLAVVDPPYAINRFKNGETSRLRKYGSIKTVNDLRPTKKWFQELVRVSKNQIVFGYNHLCDILPPTPEFIFWYKHQPVTSYSDGELAWTSFKKTAKCFDYPFFGGIGADKDGRIHPTQKPVALYTWIFQNYAKPGDKILDTHLGSGSSRIAAYEQGIDFVGFEIDKRYFDLQEERFDAHTAQMSLFRMEG